MKFGVVCRGEERRGGQKGDGRLVQEDPALNDMDHIAEKSKALNFVSKLKY